MTNKKETENDKMMHVYCAWCSSFMYQVNVESNPFGEDRSHGICQICIKKYFSHIYKKL